MRLLYRVVRSAAFWEKKGCGIAAAHSFLPPPALLVDLPSFRAEGEVASILCYTSSILILSFLLYHLNQRISLAFWTQIRTSTRGSFDSRQQPATTLIIPKISSERTRSSSEPTCLANELTFIVEFESCRGWSLTFRTTQKSVHDSPSFPRNQLPRPLFNFEHISIQMNNDNVEAGPLGAGVAVPRPTVWNR